jgi:hypothetical protein
MKHSPLLYMIAQAEWRLPTEQERYGANIKWDSLITDIKASGYRETGFIRELADSSNDVGWWMVLSFGVLDIYTKGACEPTRRHRFQFAIPKGQTQ